jgi:hypothetical protein
MIKGIQHLFPFIILLSSLSSCLFKASDESDVYTGVDESCDKLPKCEPLNSAPYSKSKDFSFWYWPKNHRPVENWPTVFTSMHFLTGHYGAVFDEASGQLLNLGSFSGNLSMNASALRSVDELTSLPSASISFQTGTTQSPVTATGFFGENGFTTSRARLIDAGRFMNRLDIPMVTYSGEATLTGKIEISSMPKHMVISHTISSSDVRLGKKSRIILGGDFLNSQGYTFAALSPNAMKASKSDGSGWIFVTYEKAHPENEGVVTLSLNSNQQIVAEMTNPSISSLDAKISLLLAPLQALNQEEINLYLNPLGSLTVSYQLLNLTGEGVSAKTDVDWDEALGAFRVDLGTLQDAGAPNGADYENSIYHNWYGRHLIEVTMSESLNSSLNQKDISVPIAFFGNQKVSWYITGGVPIIRDLNGEPTGLPVQISKNWHNFYWYHFYALPNFNKKTSRSFEFTVASSKWGEAYAASHAQLSLVGWGNLCGHWDESALGVFGESITYDPDVTLQRAMIDDVRPFLVHAKNKWSWTGNVGGADFLRYRSSDLPNTTRRVSRVRSLYHSIGPNLTKVTYSGISSDNKIQVNVTSKLSATNDHVRVYYHLDYKFLENVEYERLAFFQMAADNYADNNFLSYSYGNENGVLFTQNITNHGTTGYASIADRGISLSGTSPWIFLYNNQITGDDLSERFANVGFIIREFEAKIGTSTLSTPYINLSRTNNSYSQMSFELGLPLVDGSPWCGQPCQNKTRFIPQGSTLKAVIEYVVLPSDKTKYYGTGNWLVDLLTNSFNTPDIIKKAAQDNHLTLSMIKGNLQQTYPPLITGIDGHTAAEFELQGGLGFLPVTIQGLYRHDKWKLQYYESNTWSDLDQSVHGNDFWQTNQNLEDGTYSLTFSLPEAILKTKKRYRLVFN